MLDSSEIAHHRTVPARRLPPPALAITQPFQKNSDRVTCFSTPRTASERSTHLASSLASPFPGSLAGRGSRVVTERSLRSLPAPSKGSSCPASGRHSPKSTQLATPLPPRQLEPLEDAVYRKRLAPPPSQSQSRSYVEIATLSGSCDGMVEVQPLSLDASVSTSRERRPPPLPQVLLPTTNPNAPQKHQVVMGPARTAPEVAPRYTPLTHVDIRPPGTSTYTRHRNNNNNVTVPTMQFSQTRSEDLLDLNSLDRRTSFASATPDEPLMLKSLDEVTPYAVIPPTARSRVTESRPQRALLQAVRTTLQHLQETPVAHKPTAATPVALMKPLAPVIPLLPHIVSGASIEDTGALTDATAAIGEKERKALLSACYAMERCLVSRPSLTSATHLTTTAAKRTLSDTSTVQDNAGLTSHSPSSAITVNASVSTANTVNSHQCNSVGTSSVSVLSLYAPGHPTALSGTPAKLLTPTSDRGGAASPSHDGEVQSPLSSVKSADSFDRGYSKSDTEALTDPERVATHVHRAANRVLILLESWQFISTNCYDAFADAFFAELLRTHPEYASLFIGKDVKQQALSVMAMVGRAVVAVAEPAGTMDLMRELGARHRLYGIDATHYKAMEDAFFLCLRKFLSEEEYTKSLPSWTNVWGVMTGLMLSGAVSDRGEYFGEQRKVEWIAEVQRVMRTVRTVEARDSDGIRRHSFPLTMYNIAVADRRELSAFSNMATVRTGDRLMNSIYYIVDHLADADQSALQEYIKLISARHEEYGVTAQALRDFTNYFVAAVAYYLDKLDEDEVDAVWSRFSRRRLVAFWNFLVSHWSDGFTKKKERMALLKGLGLDGSQAITLIFTDIEQSTSLWEKNGAAMGVAVRQHHSIIRSLIADAGAFEVKTVGDSFMIACSNPTLALKIAVGIQLDLMRQAIAPGFVMCDNVAGAGDPKCWRQDSMRVRIGIHMGRDVTAVYDAVHNRYDYYGPAVNCAARVESAAAGGQILMTYDCLEALAGAKAFTEEPVSLQLRTWENVDTLQNNSSPKKLRRRFTFLAKRPLKDFVCFCESADLQLRGISQPVKVVSVLPRALDGRRFPNQGRPVTLDALLEEIRSAPMSE